MDHRSLNILLVEDEAPVAKLIEHFLRDAGYLVHTAVNGLEGLFLFRRHAEWDAVILDRAMPEMGGEDLAAMIKLISPTLPIVMITGNIHAVERAQLFAAVLAKPFRPTELLDCLTSIFRETSTV